MRTDELLVTKAVVNKNEKLRANQRMAKKASKRKLFDFSSKLYKITGLAEEGLIDLTGAGSDVCYDSAAIPGNPEEILKRISSTKIEGLSGGCFPSARKIQTVIESKAEEKYFVVNAIECDPGLLHDEWLLLNEWRAIELGLKAVCRLMNFKKVIVASRHKTEASDVAERIGTETFEFKRFGYQYPLGEEHLLIEKSLGMRLNRQEIPAKSGILVLNIQTVYAIGQAVALNTAPMYRFITAANMMTGEAVVMKVPFGLKAARALDEAFSMPEGYRKYSGSGLLNAHMLEAGEIILSSTNFLAYAEEIQFADTSSCKSCGGCTRKCPAGVPVSSVIKMIKQGERVAGELVSPCMECNSCTYNCPAGINVRSYIMDCKD